MLGLEESQEHPRKNVALEEMPSEEIYVGKVQMGNDNNFQNIK